MSAPTLVKFSAIEPGNNVLPEADQSKLGVPTTTLTHRGSGWRYAPDELLWYPPTTKMWKKDRGESWRECVGQLTRQRRDSEQAAA